jgi:[ribosomal protein S5]-alanine N-acetyltransferase
VVLDGLQASQVRLVAATPALLRAELRSTDELGYALAAPLPRDWPPETWDRTAVRWLADHLAAHPDEVGWWAAYLVSHDGVVVGTAGLKGPPRDGEVEVGYALVRSAFGLGYATDAIAAIVAACRRRADVTRVVAHTLTDGTASIAVLERVGFVAAGDGPEPGTRRYELPVAG